MTTCRLGDGMRKRAATLVGIIAGLLFLLACETTTLTPTPAQPPVVTSSALRPTLEALEVEHYAQQIRAEQAARDAQATLTVIYAQGTATAVAAQATATQQAGLATATAIAAQATATQQAAFATATREARQAQETATAWQATVTAQQAQATATAEVARATATVQASIFNQQATATVAAWEVQATETVAAARARATIQAAEVYRAELAAERDRIVTPIKAWGPWVLIVVSAITFLVGAWRLFRGLEMRLRALPRDRRGDAPLLVMDQRGGQIVVYDPDRALGPATVIGREVTQPQLAPPEDQERVTARDQAIDLAHRGSTGQARSPTARQRQAAQLMSTLKPPPYHVLVPGQNAPPALIDEQARRALQVDWKQEEV